MCVATWQGSGVYTPTDTHTQDIPWMVPSCESSSASLLPPPWPVPTSSTKLCESVWIYCCGWLNEKEIGMDVASFFFGLTLRHESSASLSGSSTNTTPDAYTTCPPKDSSVHVCVCNYILIMCVNKKRKCIPIHSLTHLALPSSPSILPPPQSSPE